MASELLYAAEYRATVYQACVLLGPDDDETRVQVTGFTDLAVFDDPFSFVRDLARGWERMLSRAERMDDALRPVGWATFRAGDPSHLSAHEAIVHRTFFNNPRQVTVTVDPASGVMKAFGDEDGVLVPFRLPQPQRALTSAQPGEPA